MALLRPPTQGILRSEQRRDRRKILGRNEYDFERNL
jgi:hypothetical protein